LREDRQAVEHVMLRVELDREPQIVFGCDVSGPLEVLDRLLDRTLHLARRAHQRLAIERYRIFAALAENLEQPLALLAGGKQPAIFHAHHADGNAALTDKVEHLAVAHAGIETTLEIGAAKFDRVETALFCSIERRLQRCRIDRPGMECQPAEFPAHAMPCPKSQMSADCCPPRRQSPALSI